MTDHRSSEQLMNEARNTRADIDATLAELEERLSPERLADLVGQALVPARAGTVRFARNLGASAQDNPVAATLAAVGLGWLMMSRRRDREYVGTAHAPYGRAGLHGDYGDEPDGRLDPSRRSTENRTSIIMPGEERSMEGRNESFRRPGMDPDAVVTPGAGPYAGVNQHAERLIVPGGSASSRSDFSSARDGARERAEDIAGRLRERSGHAYRWASDAARRAGTRTRDTSSSLGDIVRERPMMAGLVLAGLGALVAGTVFARSDRGREVISRGAYSVRDGSRRVGERVRREVDSRRGAMSDAGAAAERSLKDVDARIKDTAERARKRAQSMAASPAASGTELPDNAPSTGPGYRLSPEDAAVSAPEPHTTEPYGTAATSSPSSDTLHPKAEPTINMPQPVKPVPVTPPRSGGDGDASSKPGLPPKLDSTTGDGPKEPDGKPADDWKGTDTQSKTGGLGGGTRDGRI